MDNAIKEIIIPFLRNKNFKGSYPHFRREKNGQLNLLTFQFSLYSPQFVVEISNCPTGGMTTAFGKELKPAQCRVHYIANRLRIGSIKAEQIIGMTLTNNRFLEMFLIKEPRKY